MGELSEEARKVAVMLIQEGIAAANPKKAVKAAISLDDKHGIVICGKAVGRPKRAIVVGAGKATGGMAEAVEEVLGDLVTGGVIAIPKELVGKYSLSRIKVMGSTHPSPSELSVEAGKAIVEAAKSAGEGDLVLALFSGGGSALMEYPVEGVTIEDIKAVSRDLMNAGANIVELNAVRKHLSMVKGGWLAKHAYPARVVCLMISDVVGDRMDTIASGPTVPDLTTFSDAVSVLKRYGLWDSAPEPVKSYLTRGLQGEVPETPKPEDPIFKNVINQVIASNLISLNAMKRKAESLGYNTLLLTSLIEGEAREVGKVLAAIAKEVARSGNPVEPPAVIVAGGETTVTVRGKGRGGRNQELALSAAIELEGTEGIAIASVGSDGRDGPTDAAGAVVDGETATRAKKMGLDPLAYLDDNNSYEFFKAVGGHIVTGYTGTNVNDLIAIVIQCKKH